MLTGYQDFEEGLLWDTDIIMHKTYQHGDSKITVYLIVI